MKHILIINQHGENRGDEAAMRAMLAGFQEQLGEVRFTLLYQFQDRSLRLQFREDVTDLPIVLPPADYLTAALFSAGSLGRLDLKPLLTGAMQQIVSAYESADLVVSAPGGPYFGDIYAKHELVHWWYVWLAAHFKKPLFLYSPSAGPFENKLLNPVRRAMYRKFDVLATREEISHAHLLRLLGPETVVHVTADSAVQQIFEPMDRGEYLGESRRELVGRYLVAVSLNDYAYPGESDPEALRERYNTSVLRVLVRLHQRRDCHFLLTPQLYGRVHSDVPFLERMGNQLPADCSWEVIDPSLDSDGQRRLFAMCDFHLASRYHPAIFGHTGMTPGICICYEHKALGFMKQIGLERFAFDIRDLHADRLERAVDEVLESYDAIVDQLGTAIPKLQRRAQRSTDLAVQLLRERTGG